MNEQSRQFELFRAVEPLDTRMPDSEGLFSDYVVDKHRCKAVSADTSGNPYHIAMRTCLDALHDFMIEKGQQAQQMHVVVERRGKREDADLELAFRRICDGHNQHAAKLPFSVVMADKKTNSAGLQLADLVARPIGIHHLRPEKPNRAFQTLEKKFYCASGRAHVGERFDGIGLKIYP